MTKSDEPEEEEKGSTKDTRMPLEVFYCGICDLPPEYCKNANPKNFEPRKVWLKENNEELYAEIYEGAEAKEEGKKQSGPQKKKGKGPEVKKQI